MTATKPATPDATTTTTAAPTTHVTPQGVTNINATTTTAKANINMPKVKEGEKIPLQQQQPQQQGIYYTDGEYLYGPYDAATGTPLAHTTIQSLANEQHGPSSYIEIKKDIEAETKNQHKNEIAKLTAKYEHIQKSITEHLRQIDAYIENAKTALKSTIATTTNDTSNSNNTCNTKPESGNIELATLEQQRDDDDADENIIETPLKEILRKITHIMQEVKPTTHHRNLTQEVKMENVAVNTPPDPSPTTSCVLTHHQQDEEEENMPIVDKVLMDLNMLTTHLTEYDEKTSTELKPIIEQLQQQAIAVAAATTTTGAPLNLQFDIKPYPAKASYVTITEDKTNEENPLEIETNKEKKQQPTKSTTTTTSSTISPIPITTQQQQHPTTEQGKDKVTNFDK